MYVWYIIIISLYHLNITIFTNIIPTLSHVHHPINLLLLNYIYPIN